MSKFWTLELAVADTPLYRPVSVREGRVEVLRVFHATRSGRQSCESSFAATLYSPCLVKPWLA